MDPLGETSPGQRRVALARRLREQIRTRSLSQQEMAKLSGVPQSVISKLLGEKVDATPKTVKKLAEAFGLTPQGFLRGVQVESDQRLLLAPGARKASVSAASSALTLAAVAPNQTPQRSMRLRKDSFDPEAKRPVSLRDAFKGGFADDIADLAWRITCKRHLHRCHDADELRNHFDDAIEYWAQRDQSLYGAVVWPSLIQDKTGRVIIDAKRKASTQRNRLTKVDCDMDDLSDGSYGTAYGEAEAHEAHELIVDAFRCRYPDPIDRFVWLACIPELHGETVAAQAGDSTFDMYNVRHEVEQVCDETDAALAFGAEKAAEVAAVLYIERPNYRELEHVQVILQWFVAARRRIEQSNDTPLYTAFWLIEWGWKAYEAHRIAGIRYDRTDRRLAERFRKASSRFSEKVKCDAKQISISVGVLEPYVPARRAFKAV